MSGPGGAAPSTHTIEGLKARYGHVEALHAAEKGAQYAAHTSELEQRVRVLEQIVTDGGAQTAAQIEALRAPRLSKSAAPAGGERD